MGKVIAGVVMTFARRFPLFAIGFLCVGGVVWGLSKASPAPQAKPQTEGATGLHGFATNASCSSRACHGGDEPKGGADVQQDEYTFSVMHDKHPRAYAVLLEPRAKKIADNLAASNPGGKRIEAHHDQRCLACHATPESAFDQKPDKAPELAVLNWQKAGVGCEACHGASSKGDNAWLAKHTSPGEWRNNKSLDKSKYGYHDLSDLSVQAKVCAGCHVGSPADPSKNLPARDCNHDIMAAGHPRLNFELNAYRHNLPPHWNIAKKKQDTEEYQAKAWAVGRAVAAKSALELLVARADHAEKTNERWPEFAEYRCYSCHADLNPGWRDVRNEAGRNKGSLPYDSWYSTLLPSWNADLKGYDKLASEMAKPWPKPSAVTDEAKQLIGKLDTWIAKLNKDEIKPADVLKALSGNVKDAPQSWEDAMQLALAITALKKDADKTALFGPLMFPAQGEGPKGIDAEANRAKFADTIKKELK